MKKEEAEKFKGIFVKLEYKVPTKKSINIITGAIQHICNDFIIFNLNNLPNGKELKIGYESIISINQVTDNDKNE